MNHPLPESAPPSPSPDTAPAAFVGVSAQPLPPFPTLSSPRGEHTLRRMETTAGMPFRAQSFLLEDRHGEAIHLTGAELENLVGQVQDYLQSCGPSADRSQAARVSDMMRAGRGGPIRVAGPDNFPSHEDMMLGTDIVLFPNLYRVERVPHTEDQLIVDVLDPRTGQWTREGAARPTPAGATEDGEQETAGASM